MANATGNGESTGDSAMVVMDGVWKQFHNGATIDILTGADLHIGAGETLAVVGASGIGKSTFLHLLGTLDRPDRGSMQFGGQDVFDLDDRHLAAFRNRSIGFVFQFHHLLPEFNALENAMMPALIAGIPTGKAKMAAESMLIRVGLQDRLAHKVATLSGGEQQRVALARALVQSPAVLLADEPTGNLDQKNSDIVHDLLLELNRDLAMTLVVVTHNPDLAGRMKRRITIENGQLTEL